MSNQTYDYSTRNGIMPISWEDFHGLCKSLVKGVSLFQPEIVLPIGRGGFYPGTLIAHMLRLEMYPVRLSRRVNDIVKHKSPQWLMRVPAIVACRRVLIVDEICASGETISMVKDEAARLGATEVKSAVLYAHTWGTEIPDYIGLISDALLLNPWDREILKDGEFQFNPEYAEALALQGIGAECSLLIDAPIFTLAKTPADQ